MVIHFLNMSIDTHSLRLLPRKQLNMAYYYMNALKESPSPVWSSSSAPLLLVEPSGPPGPWGINLGHFLTSWIQFGVQTPWLVLREVPTLLLRIQSNP